jgi:hypothetical protein
MDLNWPYYVTFENVSCLTNTLKHRKNMLDCSIPLLIVSQELNTESL